MKKNHIPRTAALLAVYLLFSVGMTSAAQPRAPGAWTVAGSSMPAMEEMPEMPGMPDYQPGAPEKLTPYQTGVQLYLQGSDGEAISQLQEALRLDAADEKVKRLLLKVMLRAINGNYERNDYTKAHFFIQAAHKYFPDNPEVKLLYSSMSESNAAAKRKIPAARPENPPVRLRRTVEVRSPPAPAPAPQKTSQAPAASPRSPAAPCPGTGRDKGPYFFALAAFLLSAALFIIIGLRQKQDKSLLLRIESLQKALVDGEVRNAEIYKELERWKNMEEQNEELSELRKSREERMYLELEKLKAEEEAKIMAELARKRREAERAAGPAPGAGKDTFPAPGPGTGEVPALPAEPLPATGPQENNILKILAGITPPEREAAWERIAGRAAELYKTSPEEAIKFLYNLAKDGNPLNRASIVGALAAIGAPATLDILFELYNDASMEVRREAIKHLTGLQRNLTAPIDEAYRENISACLREEKTKGDWVF